MKNFQQAIKNHLDNLATTDPQFAEKYKNPKKNIEECCKYIIGEVHAKTKTQTAVMSDEEVYGMAIHYYDEDNITVRNAPVATTAKGKEVKLTTEQKKKLQEQAEREYKAQLISEYKQKELDRKAKKAKKEEVLFTGSLF